MLKRYEWPSEEARARIKTSFFEDGKIWNVVSEIVERVKKDQDKALLEYTASFDKCMLEEGDIRVKKEEIEKAYGQVEEAFIESLRQAKDNILRFHSLQKQKNWFDQDKQGSIVGQLIQPLERVGHYIPGGTANYPSSVLMTCLPAVVAGVEEIVMVTPPGKNKEVPAATLVAAKEAGVDEIYRVGGAQAIAALAYGTKTIKPVDKIVGPGNAFVTLAKKMVFGQVGIDMLAGPSEIVVVGDGSIEPAYAAADLLSQAEHDTHARAILVTPDSRWAEQVITEMDVQLTKLSRRETAVEALEKYGAVVVVKDLAEALEVANFIAPEHLELLVCEPWNCLAQIKHAGAIFLGPYSPEPLGDYWAGPNHVLPTGGSARFSSPLTVDDFCKRSSLINYSREGLLQAAGPVSVLTKAEGLAAHGAALDIRCKKEEV